MVKFISNIASIITAGLAVLTFILTFMVRKKQKWKAGHGAFSTSGTGFGICNHCKKVLRFY